MSGMDYLKQIIDIQGVKKSYLAASLGVSKTCFSNKLAGRTQFNAGEICKLKKELGLNLTQVDKIFLS